MDDEDQKPALPDMIRALIPASDDPAELARINDLAEDACTIPALLSVFQALELLHFIRTEPAATTAGGPSEYEAVITACGRLLAACVVNCEALIGETEDVAELLATVPGMAQRANVLLSELEVTTGLNQPTGFLRSGAIHDAKLLACTHCGDRLYSCQDIAAGLDSDGDEIARTHSQWMCGACGRWNGRPGTNCEGCKK